MASLNASPVVMGLDDRAIDAMVAVLGDGGCEARMRHSALERFRALPAPGPALGRYWRYNVAGIDISKIAAFADAPPGMAAAQRRPGEAGRLEQVDALAVSVSLDPALAARGVVLCDLQTGRREHAKEYAWAAGSAFDWQTTKYGSLNAAFRFGGAFLYVPKGLRISDPIVIRHRSLGAAIFPYTLVVADELAQVTVISSVEGGAFEDALSSEIVEVVAASGAGVTFAGIQTLDTRARSFSTKRAKIGQDAQVHWAIAELGGSLSVADVRSVIEQRGVQTSISGVFFADGTQHVDLETEVDHRVGDTSSDTLFKSAATDRGQARYLGNIRIHPHAHGSDATLRDDALLLSKRAHIDSIPALEIAANDVKAFHGATVGAISDDEIFYAMSRGLDRASAERMIALGFFEPAIARFPTDALRATLREAISAKIG